MFKISKLTGVCVALGVGLFSLNAPSFSSPVQLAQNSQDAQMRQLFAENMRNLVKHPHAESARQGYYLDRRLMKEMFHYPALPPANTPARRESDSLARKGCVKLEIIQFKADGTLVISPTALCASNNTQVFFDNRVFPKETMYWGIQILDNPTYGKIPLVIIKPTDLSYDMVMNYFVSGSDVLTQYFNPASHTYEAPRKWSDTRTLVQDLKNPAAARQMADSLIAAMHTQSYIDQKQLFRSMNNSNMMMNMMNTMHNTSMNIINNF